MLAGFAGSTADAMALFTKFEAKIEEYRGNLERAAVELAKDWRTDRVLRRLEAFLVVADRESSFLLSGAGDVIAPDDGIVAVGSGGPYALAAARALVRHTDARRADPGPGGHEDRGRDLHLHERPDHGGEPLGAPAPDGPLMPIQLPASQRRAAPALDRLTPREIVAELDRYVVGQAAAKSAVAIALRNRIRRQRLPPEVAAEVTPKNILMIGPTGVGKTEIARRLARLAAAPS